MEKIPQFLIKTLQDLSDAAAIIDENKYVYYVNSNFEDLFKFKIGGKIKNHCDALSGLNIKTSVKVIISPQFLSIPGHQQKISLYVYLLNKSKNQEHFYLLIARDSEKKDDRSYRIKKSNPYEDEEKYRTEKLSHEFGELVGENIEFKKALVIAQRAAKSNISVLIIGESGTGKEILARAIHGTSKRSCRPLIDVNCAAIPDTLIESELFGYEKGAFTGARTEGSRGYFDEAHEGTILLDEVGDASLRRNQSY